MPDVGARGGVTYVPFGVVDTEAPFEATHRRTLANTDGRRRDAQDADLFRHVCVALAVALAKAHETTEICF
jgi:hypothetical protein